MPHIIIEHDTKTKSEVDLKHFVKEIHTTLSEQETVALEAIKTRTINIDNVWISDGTHNQMLHITVHLLKGRSEELKEIMANALFDKAKELLSSINCSLSVNIVELGTYRK